MLKAVPALLAFAAIGLAAAPLDARSAQPPRVDLADQIQLAGCAAVDLTLAWA